jgi:threonine dehydrogenase-like Zn-dependent dehydrogenase
MRKEFQVTITSRENAELLPVPRDDSPPQSREVTGRTVASVISAGTDINGMYQAKEFPRHPGYAACFKVEAVGEQVTCVNAGDLAFCMGNHRSFQRVDELDVLPVPRKLDPAHAPFARLMGVSMATLTTVAARPPERVVVTGLGPVGHLTAAIFASCGYDTIAADPMLMRRELAARIPGVRFVLDHADPNHLELKDKIAVVVECSGYEQAALDGCNLVRKGGEVVLIGAPWTARTNVSAHDLLHPIFFRYVTLRSGWEWELPMHTTDFRHNSIWSNYAAALRWLAEGRVRVDGLYKLVSPRDCQQVYQDILHNRLDHLAAVFDWTA